MRALARSLPLRSSLLACDAAARDAAPAPRSRRARRRRRPPTSIALDPVRVTDSESIEVGELLFEGLVGWKPGTTDIEPRLATCLAGLERRPDAGRSTLRDRRDVPRRHAVRRRRRRVLVRAPARSRASAATSATTAATGARCCNDVEKVVAIDPLTVEIHGRAAVRAAARRPRDVPDRVADGGAAVGRRVQAITRSAPGRSRSSRWTKGEQVVVQRVRRLLGHARRRSTGSCSRSSSTRASG